MRATLIAYLLFTCFETFNGFLDGALTQIYASVRIIEEWQRQHAQLPKHKTSVFSPQTLVIEDELIRAFGRLELDAICYQDSRSPTLHESHVYFRQLSIDAMPSTFTSLIEARAYLDLTVHRSLHFAAFLSKEYQFNRVFSLHNLEAFKHYFVMTEEELERKLEMYNRWADAFEPLWRFSRMEEGKANFKGATALRLHYLTGIALRNALVGSGEMFYRESIPGLQEIVTLSRIFLDLSNSNSGNTGPSFNFDLQVILPLQTVGIVFRHRKLRREAIELLLGRR